MQRQGIYPGSAGQGLKSVFSSLSFQSFLVFSRTAALVALSLPNTVDLVGLTVIFIFVHEYYKYDVNLISLVWFIYSLCISIRDY